MAHKLVAMFIRHGETALNSEGKFRGNLDPDLNEDGKQQAKNLIPILGNRGINDVFTSGKKRSEQTAALALPGRKPKIVKDFNSLDIGDFAGQPKDEENMKKIIHYQENPDEKIPGGESLNDFRKRVNPNIMTVIKRGQEKGRPSVAFVHSSVIHQIGHRLHGDHNYVKVKPGGIVGVYKTQNGYEAEPIYRNSHDEQDKHLVS
jgi:broad specificity phosphatase PhoE